jgi:hypothetical protein
MQLATIAREAERTFTFMGNLQCMVRLRSKLAEPEKRRDGDNDNDQTDDVDDVVHGGPFLG